MSAANIDFLPSHPSGLIRRKEQHDISNILRIADSA